MNKAVELSAVLGDLEKMVLRFPSLVKRAGVFGPLVRGDFDPGNDINIIIEAAEPIIRDAEYFVSYRYLCDDIVKQLSTLYGCRVKVTSFMKNPRTAFRNKETVNEIVWIGDSSSNADSSVSRLRDIVNKAKEKMKLKDKF